MRLKLGLAMRKVFSKVFSFLSPKNFGVYICLGLVAMASAYYFRNSQSMRTIRVTGTAYKDVEADWAEWTVCVTKDHTNRKKTLTLLKDDQDYIMQFLLDNDITDDEITYGQYSVSSNYIYEGGRYTDVVKDYTGSVCIYVKSADVHKVARAKGNLIEYVVTNDLTTSSNDVSYLYTRLSQEKISLLEDATENAKERATALGRIRNTQIGKIQDADQGTFNINKRNDFSVSWSGNFDTSSIEKTIRGTVNVTFKVR